MDCLEKADVQRAKSATFYMCLTTLAMSSCEPTETRKASQTAIMTAELQRGQGHLRREGVIQGLRQDQADITGSQQIIIEVTVAESQDLDLGHERDIHPIALDTREIDIQGQDLGLNVQGQDPEQNIQGHGQGPILGRGFLGQNLRKGK